MSRNKHKHRTLYSLLVVAGVAVALYLLGRVSSHVDTTSGTYESAELGFAFDYPPDRYVLEEVNRSDAAAELEKTIVLTPREDAERELPQGGEAPPTITLRVFGNVNRQQPLTWADAHMAYSSINLKVGPIANTVIGGAKGIRYTNDGLYRAENVIVGHGGRIYMATGAYLDEDSDLRRDFKPIVDSIRFLPKPIAMR
jgi:hypothetical protein